MPANGDLHHQINSHLASLKAGLYVLGKELSEADESVQQRVQNLDQKVTELHTLLKTVLHDVAKTSDWLNQRGLKAFINFFP